MKKILLIIVVSVIQLSAYAQLNTERILTIGQNALYFNDYVLAIQYFNQVIKLKPYLAEPYYYRAIAKIQLGDYQGAEQDCDESLNRNPFVPEVYYARGYAWRKIGHFSESVNDFSKALEFSPENESYLLNRIDAYAQDNKFAEAMKDLDQYIRLYPKNNMMMYEKGILQLQLKDTTGALNSLNSFVAKDTANALGWSARALIYMQKNKQDSAYNDYSQAIKHNSTYAGDYINRGILNVQRKNFRLALTDYDNAVKYDKSSDLAYYNRGLLRANLGDRNNALSDLAMVIKFDSTNYEARLQKAMLEHTLGNYKASINDYNIIINKYPYFIPAFIGLAENHEALGNIKAGYKYRQIAYNIDQNKKKYKEKMKELVAENKMATKQQKVPSESNTELFNRFTEQDKTDADSKYSSTTRGNVQDKFSDVAYQKSFNLSYYSKVDEIKRTNLYHPAIQQYNKLNKLSSIIKITNNEIPLTAQLINVHFEAINSLSEKIAGNSNDPDLFFSRAIEFALVQDFNSAIEDLNKAIILRSDFMLAYFYRANIRYKLVEYQTKNADASSKDKSYVNGSKADKKTIQAQLSNDAELIMRDYDKVISLSPDFSFAYFNKANILASIRDYKAAISIYSKALEIDNDFAEAYFNRGLTYININKDENGINDLSKAGELGIYSSYNLIQRFKKTENNNQQSDK